MMREIEAVPNGPLEGLRVIGFHGEVKPTRTPGRSEPIYVDEQGRLVRIEQVGPSRDAVGTRKVWLKVGPAAGEGPLPGHATRFDAPLPAYLGYLVMVVGRDERKWASSIRSIEPAMDTPDLRRFLDWLVSWDVPPPEGLRVRMPGEVVAWYCNEQNASGLHQRIAGVARNELIEAAQARNQGRLYQASWWLSRAGLDDSDQFLAAVGLRHSSPPVADAFVQGGFPGRPVEEVQAGLVRAEQIFQSLCQWKEPEQALRKTNIGSVLDARRAHARARHLVPLEGHG
jgi:hypothetical protein